MHSTNQRRTRNNRQSGFAAVIIGVCIFSILEFNSYFPSTDDGRRSLLSTLYLQATHSTLLPWAHHHLVDITESPKSSEATAMFWHIPKSGGTTAKRLYMCMGQTLTIRVGVNPIFGHNEEDELVVFEPEKGRDWKTVNVDTTIKPGILRAKELGLVQSKTTDLIFTMEPNFAGQHLFDEEHKGRILALFRHPIDRIVSKFYYLQTATWERTYRPEWANMSIIEWAKLPSEDENFMVRKLAGKTFGDPLEEKDLILAKELLRQRVVVGLMSEMEESFRRFNIALGVDETTERNKKCMDEFFGENEKEEEKIEEEKTEEEKPEEEKPEEENPEEEKSEESKEGETVVKTNSNKHPKVVENTPEWDILSEKNHLDMILYAYVEKLFKEQKEIIDSYVSALNGDNIAVSDAPVDEGTTATPQ